MDKQINEIKKENKSLNEHLTDISYNNKNQIEGRITISKKKNFNNDDKTYPIFFLIFMASLGVILGKIFSLFIFRK